MGGNAAGGQGGFWHRDGEGLWDDEGVDLNLPAFTATSLVALDDLAPEDGPTEFIRGSHREQLISQGVDSSIKLRDWADRPEQRVSTTRNPPLRVSPRHCF